MDGQDLAEDVVTGAAVGTISKKSEPLPETLDPLSEQAEPKAISTPAPASEEQVVPSVTVEPLPGAEELPSGDDVPEDGSDKPSLVGNDQVGSVATHERTASELDVAKGDAVLKPMHTLPGLVAHTVGNLVGGASLGAGWALGKADVAVGRRGGLPVPGFGGAKQVSDSGAFKLGFRTWLYANGVMPTVLLEQGPYGNDIGPLPQDPDSRRRLLRNTSLIVSNHVSYLDTVVLPLVLEVPKLMAMREVASWPLFGQLCQEMDMIWVDRSDPASRSAAKRAIAEHVEQWTDGERPLLIWPEGTTSNGRGLKDFKNGAFLAGVPIRPVVIKYTGDWDPANVNFREASPQDNPPENATSTRRSSGSSSGSDIADSVDYGDAEWARQFFGHIIHSCTVLICKPYKPTDAERRDPELFKENVRNLMRERLQELHEREDKKREEKARSSSFLNVDKLIGNVSQGADKFFGNVSRGLATAFEKARTGSTRGGS